ncbi:MAG: DNA repair protein RecO [Planctomycetota bacterium]
MAFRKTEAITIYQKDYSESSQIITFYTKDYGKITLLARGVYRAKHRTLSPPDLFSYNEIVFLERFPQGINLLTEITIKDNFPYLRLDLERLNRAFYIAEFLIELTEPAESNRELFDLVLKTIRQLSFSLNNSRDKEEIAIFSFEAQALKYLGYMPNTFCCVICGKVTDNYKVAFSLYNGSFICSDCRNKHPNRILQFTNALPFNRKMANQLHNNDLLEVSAGVMKLMHILSNPFLPDLERLKITKSMQSELRNFIKKYIAYITGKEFNAMKLS